MPRNKPVINSAVTGIAQGRHRADQRDARQTSRETAAQKILQEMTPGLEKLVQESGGQFSWGSKGWIHVWGGLVIETNVPSANPPYIDRAKIIIKPGKITGMGFKPAQVGAGGVYSPEITADLSKSGAVGTFMRELSAALAEIRVVPAEPVTAQKKPAPAELHA